MLWPICEPPIGALARTTMNSDTGHESPSTIPNARRIEAVAAQSIAYHAGRSRPATENHYEVATGERQVRRFEDRVADDQTEHADRPCGENPEQIDPDELQRKRFSSDWFRERDLEMPVVLAREGQPPISFRRSARETLQ